MFHILAISFLSFWYFSKFSFTFSPILLSPGIVVIIIIIIIINNINIIIITLMRGVYHQLLTSYTLSLFFS